MKDIITLKKPVTIISAASVVGKKEREGPLGACFDLYDEDGRFGMKTWELAEGEIQRLALSMAHSKKTLSPSDTEILIAGDLQNQCVASTFGLLETGIPYLGIYGACSTSAEGLAIGSLIISGEHAARCATVSSSHNCTAERQFRFPLEYGSQRTPSAQWTVTGAGAFILDRRGRGPKISEVLIGRMCDKGITDANNMGAAMAPAAYDTLTRYFKASKKSPSDFDFIITGDLGYEGSEILRDFLSADGLDIQSVHRDCGLEIYGREKQDVHAGGSGCGCGAAVLASHFLPMLESGGASDILYIATGALMSPTSALQGQSIPSIAHLVRIKSE